MLINRIRNIILRKQFADRTLLSFGTRAVIANYVNDERIIPQPSIFESFNQSADLRIGVTSRRRSTPG